MPGVPIAFRPLSAATAAKLPADARRRRAPFSALLSTTYDDLDLELRAIGARDVVIEVDVPGSQVTRDGRPYARAVALTPRIAVHYTSNRTDQTVTITCGTFATWDDNLRAVVLTMNALRLVQRYGTAPNDEQYRGFTALPATIAPRMTLRQAAEKLASYAPPITADDVTGNVAAAHIAARHAKASTHPESSNGRSGDWAEVQDALAIVTAHHRGRL